MQQILRIEHTDFSLLVQTNHLDKAFRQCREKHGECFANCCSYELPGGKLFLYKEGSDQLTEVDYTKELYPVIFENKEYSFSIIFQDQNAVKEVNIHTSPLQDTGKNDFFPVTPYIYAGAINFGNDIGKSDLVIRYQLGGEHRQFNFRFVVFPIKLNYVKDYQTILADIQKEYPGMVLSFLKKTYSTFRSGGDFNSDNIWWQVFGGLYEELIHASKFILNKPHNRIVKHTEYVKAEKIRRWTPLLEEEYHQHRSSSQKYYRYDSHTLSTDTPENRFFKFVIGKISYEYKRLSGYIRKEYKGSISKQLSKELSGVDKELDRIRNNPFFRNIGEYRGIRQESLVLQKANGYNIIYKVWIMLNAGIRFLEGMQRIELKSISELYQIWCFLEMKNMITQLLGNNASGGNLITEIRTDGFVLSFEKGVRSKITFQKENGDLIELYHEYAYDTSSEKIKSYTVKQQPDIVLQLTKNDLRDNYTLTYLYDAKYRIDAPSGSDKYDSPPSDAINQMHRYRDAIYYDNRQSGKPEKEVIGGYVLFPGGDEADKVKNTPYYTSIDRVNIGAFPMPPGEHGNRKIIRDHLKDILSHDTDYILRDVAPHKENRYEAVNPHVLIGWVASEEHFPYQKDGELFYYTGKKKPTRFPFNELRYFAPYIKGKGIREYYEIVGYDFVKRSEIFPEGHELYSVDKSERLHIRLGESCYLGKNKAYFKIKNRGQTPYSYTNLKSLRNPDNEGNIEILRDNKKEKRVYNKYLDYALEKKRLKGAVL